VPWLVHHCDRVLACRGNSSGKLCSPRLVHALHLFEPSALCARRSAYAGRTGRLRELGEHVGPASRQSSGCHTGSSQRSRSFCDEQRRCVATVIIVRTVVF
jgi:hypothetical protein